jgi:hypothetical protein
MLISCDCYSDHRNLLYYTSCLFVIKIIASSVLSNNEQKSSPESGDMSKIKNIIIPGSNCALNDNSSSTYAQYMACFVFKRLKELDLTLDPPFRSMAITVELS